jgi:hypothetical protein
MLEKPLTCESRAQMRLFDEKHPEVKYLVAGYLIFQDSLSKLKTDVCFFALAAETGKAGQTMQADSGQTEKCLTLYWIRSAPD